MWWFSDVEVGYPAAVEGTRMGNPNLEPEDRPNTPDQRLDSPGPELDPAGPRTTVEDAMDVVSDGDGRAHESAYTPAPGLTERSLPDEREFGPPEPDTDEDRDAHAEDPDADLDPDVRNEVRRARESDRDAGIEGPEVGRFTDEPD